MSLLKTQKISKSFKALQVLKDVSLEVQENERHVIIGPNGAGKTTLFNCLTGFLPISSGKIFLQNQDISTMETHKRVGLGMSRTYQKNNLFWNLTVKENVYLAITSNKPYKYRFFKPLDSYADIRAEADELIEQWNLLERKDRIVSELSYGEQRVLEVMLAVALKPKVLLLDEPTSGMSPAETAHTTKLIQQLPRSMTMVIIEHDMDVVFSIADRITVLHHGELLLSGSPDEIRNNSLVQDVYFGGGALSHADD